MLRSKLFRLRSLASVLDDRVDDDDDDGDGDDHDDDNDDRRPFP